MLIFCNVLRIWAKAVYNLCVYTENSIHQLTFPTTIADKPTELFAELPILKMDHSLLQYCNSRLFNRHCFLDGSPGIKKEQHQHRSRDRIAVDEPTCL